MRLVRLSIIATLLVLSLATAAPSAAALNFLELPQDDAGRGEDAPDPGEAPWPLEQGSYDGGLVYYLEQDPEDWYSIVVPPTTALRLTFEATQGGLWGGIHDARDGALVTNAHSSGDTVVLRAGPGVYNVGFGDHRATVGTASYEFTLEILQNDAGSRRDVGPAPHPIAAGTYSGALLFGGGDKEDWYTITAPPTTTLRFTFHATSGGFYGGIHRATDGSMVRNAYSAGGTVVLLAPAGTYNLGLGQHLATSGTASYSFTVEIVQNDAGTGGDVGPAPMPVGPGALAGALVFAGKADNEDWYRVDVPEGQTLRFTFRATSGGFYGGIHRADDGSMLTNAYSSGQSVTLTAPAGSYHLGLGDHLASRGTASYEVLVAFA